MMDIVLVYDDRVKPNKEISEINGGRSFGTTMYKRKSLLDITRDKCQVPVRVLDDKSELIKDLSAKAVICHLYSSFMIKDQELFDIIVRKSQYAKQVYQVKNVDAIGELPAMLIFPTKDSYEAFLADEQSVDGVETIEAPAFMYLGEQSAFLNFITGGFDARFFNSLEGDYHVVTKRSTNKDKIKREYSFYGLLPEDMKHFFVQPFDYREEKNSACYSMERYHTTDIAIRYAHGAVDENELAQIMDTLFYFIDRRHKKKVSREEYEKVRNELYVNKLHKRIEELKQHPEFDKIETQIAKGTKYSGIDEVVSTYNTLFNKLLKNHKAKEYFLVVGHGDLCFSNILYQKDAGIIKFIDPKGALAEEELYMDECYDLAKLSHSVCGAYDFFNTGLYEITFGTNLELVLNIDRKAERDIAIFAARLKDRGIALEEIRLYEASLFLSMLPLHMDNPRKVLGFVLNAINILEEIKNGK